MSVIQALKERNLGWAEKQGCRVCMRNTGWESAIERLPSEA